jgi:hypothetical protein
MGNASQDVQHAATFVTASNTDEGVALAMERFVLRAQTGLTRGATGENRSCGRGKNCR